MSDAGPPVLAAADPESIQAAAEALWATGIVGIPTETVYGLAVMPWREPLEALLRAKRRPAEKGIALLVGSLSQVEAIAEVVPVARTLAARFWPGPLTIVLQPRSNMAFPEALYGPTGGLGFRLPDHPVPRALSALTGPIALTSANTSGEPEALTAHQLVAAMGEALSLVIDGGLSQGGVPSTVVECQMDELRILRDGAIAAAEIHAALGRGPAANRTAATP